MLKLYMAGNKIIKDKEEDEDKGELFSSIDLSALPEGCIATAISFTTPRDACRLAAVSKVFKSASDSDGVWECFLPSDYQEILSRCDGGKGLVLLDCLNKKELFLSLCDHPLLLDSGTKSFCLDKLTGKKCYTIASRDLDITWADTPRYWKWKSEPQSRFSEVAELISVCWLEIRGKMKKSMLSPDTNYAAYLVFKMTESAYGFYSPAEVVVSFAGGKSKSHNVYLEREEGRNQRYQIIPRRIGLFNRIINPLIQTQPASQEDNDKMLPQGRKDGWLEVKIGDFLTRTGEDEEVEMAVLEVKGGSWKGGLIVEGIEIRPKETSE